MHTYNLQCRPKRSHLTNVVHVYILQTRHLTIHAMLHGHRWRVVCVPEWAHAGQIHPCLHMQVYPSV